MGAVVEVAEQVPKTVQTTRGSARLVADAFADLSQRLLSRSTPPRLLAMTFPGAAISAAQEAQTSVSAWTVIDA